MPLKRSRLMRSGSIDVQVVAPMPSPPSAASPDLWRRWSPSIFVPEAPISKRLDQARPPSIFTICSPLVQEQLPFAGGDWTHNFFEKCSSCNKKISLESEVYMYRDLRAFCSVECRERQMLIDARMTEKGQASKRIESGGKRPISP